MNRISDGSIIATRTDRLGSRLAAIINAMRIAQTYDRPFFFSWALGGHVSEELRDPTEIFDLGFFEAHLAQDEALRPVQRHLFDLSLEKSEKLKAGLTGALQPGGYKCTSYRPLVLDWEDADQTCAALSDMFGEIGFNPQMKAAMTDITAQMEGQNDALHIRRGDIVDDYIISNRLWRDKYIPRAFYQRYLDAYLVPQAKTALVFSDTPAEVAWLQQRYPQVRSVDDLLPDNLTVAQRDFLELFAMSRCAAIYGPPDSAYSIAAAAIGNIPIYDVRTAMAAEDLDAAHALLTLTLEAGPESFHGMGDAGQTLAFALDYLDETDQGDRSTALVKQYLDAGLDKIYFLGTAVTRLSASGDFKDSRAAFDLTQKAVPVRMFPARVAEFWTNVHCGSALACLGMADVDAMAFHIAQGVWNSGTGAAVHLLSHAIAHVDGINPKDLVYPVDLNLRVPMAADQKVSAIEEQFLNQMGEDTILWRAPEDQLALDWEHYLFTAKRVDPGLAGRRLRRLFAPHCPLQVWQSSLGGYLSAAGDHKAAMIAHQKALKIAPDNPLYLKRMATGLFAMDEGIEALTLLDRAASLAPDFVIYQAEFARQLAAMGDVATGATMLTDLCKEQAIVPAFPQMAVDLRRKAGLIDDDLADLIDRALQLAPSHRPLSILKAHVLVDLGRLSDAKCELDKLVLHYGESGDLKSLAARITATPVSS